MKLRDLYENYELKRSEYVNKEDKKLPKHILLENEHVQIILFYYTFEIVIGGKRIYTIDGSQAVRDRYDVFNYTPDEVIGSEDILHFIDDNKDYINIPKGLKMGMYPYNYYGYTGWKIFDNNFPIRLLNGLDTKKQMNIQSFYTNDMIKKDDNYGYQVYTTQYKLVIDDGIIRGVLKYDDGTDDNIMMNGWYRLK